MMNTTKASTQGKHFIALVALILLSIAVIYRIDNQANWISISLQLIDMSSQMSTSFSLDKLTVSVALELSEIIQINLLISQ